MKAPGRICLCLGVEGEPALLDGEGRSGLISRSGVWGRGSSFAGSVCRATREIWRRRGGGRTRG